MASEIHPQMFIRLETEDTDGSIISRDMKPFVLKPVEAVWDSCLNLHFFVKLDACPMVTANDGLFGGPVEVNNKVECRTEGLGGCERVWEDGQAV